MNEDCYGLSYIAQALRFCECFAMSAHDLHYALLRPPILHILRAAGFHATCTGVLDTLVDLAARYFALLASKTAIHALSNNNELMPTVMDVRMALQDAGALWPQRSVMEEQAQDEEDMRGVEGFIGWIKGEGNQEIRRIAGLVPTPEEVEEVGTEVKEDFLSGIAFHPCFCLCASC